MWAWIKKHNEIWVLLTDALILPGMFLCRWLTENMLATERPCVWTLLGGQCITCGGTHFVNDLCNFRIWAALQDNEFLFASAVYLAVTLVFLNLWLVFRLTFFKKALQKMYNIPTLIIWLAVMLLFFFVRNIPVFIRILEYIFR